MDFVENHVGEKVYFDLEVGSSQMDQLNQPTLEGDSKVYSMVVNTQHWINGLRSIWQLSHPTIFSMARYLSRLDSYVERSGLWEDTELALALVDSSYKQCPRLEQVLISLLIAYLKSIGRSL